MANFYSQIPIRIRGALSTENHTEKGNLFGVEQGIQKKITQIAAAILHYLVPAILKDLFMKVK